MVLNVVKVCDTPPIQADEEVSIIGFKSASETNDYPEVSKEEMPMWVYLERLLEQIENLLTLEENETIDEEEFALESARNVTRTL